jgi:DNA-binding XRE family transcriptional regulator
VSRTTTRSYSRYTRQALVLLGALVRAARTEQKMTSQGLADRAGISRDMLYRIEKGDPRCEIGVVFELAAIVGVTLFEPELAGLQGRRLEMDARMALLPRSVRKPAGGVKDDF